MVLEYQKGIMQATENILEALQVLTTDAGQVREVRIPKAGKQGTISGYYDNVEKMAEDLGRANGKFEGIYITLNPVSPDLLARAANRLKAYSKDTTNDMGILRRDWFFFDCDPIRPTGISATEEEKRAARQMANNIKRYLLERGWPEPWICDSGNGYHVIYRIDLPNNDEARKLVEGVLKSMAAALDNAVVKIDQKVFNAARIIKAYGTKACKGDSTGSRPHRFAQAYTPPNPIVIVTKEQMQAIAGAIPVKEKPTIAATSVGEGDWTEELVESLILGKLRDAGQRIKGPFHESWIKKDKITEEMVHHEAQKWQHDCLSNSDHHSPDAFTLLEQGWVYHRCAHDSCKPLTTEEWRACWEAATNEKYPVPPVRGGFEIDEVGPDEDTNIVEPKVKETPTLHEVEDKPERVAVAAQPTVVKRGVYYPELAPDVDAICPEGTKFRELVEAACQGGDL